jgi:DNA primase
VVEKPDIIGAVFGQTEGLLGSELDLRELQRTGRIGRIDVKIKSVKGKSEGEIIIPSSLDAAETSLIAATLETIERVGPCTAKIKLKEVEDTRSDKRKYVIDKAKEILKDLSEMGAPDSSDISEEIKEAVRTGEVTEVFGLTAGPAVVDSDDIVIVEGRADVINLLKFGIRNTVAIEGTSVSKEVIELCKRKNTTLFVDGDRGGELIAKEIMQKTELDYIAQAPEGKEVEELTQKEAYKSLREKVPAKVFITEGPRRGKISVEEKKEDAPKGIQRGAQTGKPDPKAAERRSASRTTERRPASRTSTARMAPSGGTSTRGTGSRVMGARRTSDRGRSSGRGYGRRDSRGRRDDRPRAPRRIRLSDEESGLFKKTIKELVGTRAACIFNDKYELLGRVPVSELENTLRTMEDPHAVIFDGKVDYRLNEVAKRKGVRFLVGMEKEDIFSSIAIMSRKDLEE